jgi:glucose-6-phosphate 1-dehydrogenase
MPGVNASDRIETVPDQEHCTTVIFGSSGDLARNKLLPALFALYRKGFMAPGCSVYGVSRSLATDGEFREQARQSLAAGCSPDQPDPAQLEKFLERLHAFQGDHEKPDSFRLLSGVLPKGNRLFYLAVPPSSFGTIVENLGAAGLTPRGTGNSPDGWSRVVIEKPFGNDLESARALNLKISRHLSEDQVYRIDHYLAKETVQNILAFRFANAIFEPVWNSRYVDHVQVTIAEKGGVGTRGQFYEATGALKDIFQNHLLQVLTFVAMEPPPAFDAGAIRDEQVKVLESIRPFRACDANGCAVRAQYGPGTVDGRPVPGYRGERGVAADSTVETFVAMKLFIDSPRWTGIPFFLRTGKRLNKTVTEVAVRFTNDPPPLLKSVPAGQRQPNELVIRIQPDEGISLSFSAKSPGTGLNLETATLDFSYAKFFGDEPPPAYERVLLDALRGDASLFIRSDVAEAAWRAVQPMQESWRSETPAILPSYEAGSWGPAEADRLIGGEGRRWRAP